MLVPLPLWWVLPWEAAAATTSYDVWVGEPALTQGFVGGELAFRFGPGPADFGVGAIARLTRAPGEGPVELGGWVDLRAFVRSGSVEVAGGGMLGVGNIVYSDGGYVPGGVAGVRVGPSYSSRWGPGVRLGGEVRAVLFSAGVDGTCLLGVRKDTVPRFALPTVTHSVEGWMVQPVVVGRPLRVPGGHVLPSARPGLVGSARRWYDQAREELASVATFGRLAEELAELGAPRSLVSLARRAAAEEAGHARACLALARRHAGRHLVLGPVPRPPPRRPSRRRLAAEAWLDGVLGEGAGARDAAIEAGTTPDRGAARALATIAREERGHADLGAAVLDWSGFTPRDRP
jgi:hypothetical protein